MRQLTQASAAYLGPLDTARRTARREAHARLLTAALNHAEAVEPLLHVVRAPNAECRTRIDAVNNHYPVDLAVQHVRLEGPADGNIYDSAVLVEVAAMRLGIVLGEPGSEPRQAHEGLLRATDAFATAAGEHLGRWGLGQEGQMRRRRWQRNRL
ncbi:hypothetical protein ACFVUY_40200 [Kitasatospora sp. NPDC058063]|uniref:hypothetical protein n=1 Tax=unclassified Kitasatospora TaxID=2633591 RepID=UPI0036DAFD14